LGYSSITYSLSTDDKEIVWEFIRPFDCPYRRAEALGVNNRRGEIKAAVQLQRERWR
jgi:hypothetical protein